MYILCNITSTDHTKIPLRKFNKFLFLPLIIVLIYALTIIIKTMTENNKLNIIIMIYIIFIVFYLLIINYKYRMQNLLHLFILLVIIIIVEILALFIFMSLVTPEDTKNSVWPAVFFIIMKIILLLMYTYITPKIFSSFINRNRIEDWDFETNELKNIDELKDHIDENNDESENDNI